MIIVFERESLCCVSNGRKFSHHFISYTQTEVSMNISLNVLAISIHVATLIYSLICIVMTSRSTIWCYTDIISFILLLSIFLLSSLFSITDTLSGE